MLRAVATSMEAKDPHLLAAMDGRDSVPEAISKDLPAEPRKEPTAFFFILFGLVYEALSTSSSDSSNSASKRKATFIGALQALKWLVRPEYSGKAILEPTIFDEFISLMYRIAMTEPADVQVHLIAALSAFAATQGSSS
jgi:HEAT repeat-containing protein 5